MDPKFDEIITTRERFRELMHETGAVTEATPKPISVAAANHPKGMS